MSSNHLKPEYVLGKTVLARSAVDGFEVTTVEYVDTFMGPIVHVEWKVQIAGKNVAWPSSRDEAIREHERQVGLLKNERWRW